MDCIQPQGYAGLAQGGAAHLRRGFVRRTIGRDAPNRQGIARVRGAGVLELIEDDADGTYRAVYTVRYAIAVYVLHVFQKKSKRGGKTPQHDIDGIRERPKRAAELHASSVKEAR